MTKKKKKKRPLGENIFILQEPETKLRTLDRIEKKQGLKVFVDARHKQQVEAKNEEIRSLKTLLRAIAKKRRSEHKKRERKH